MKFLKNLFLITFTLIASLGTSQVRTVMIDADTGNEVDDPYAIIRALLEPSFHVVGLNAAQWQATHWNIPRTMENSFRINETLLAYMDLSAEVPNNRGAEDRLFDWGQKQHASMASFEMIQHAKKMKNGDKLHVVCLGALTNVASAILMDPTITDKISVYWLGSQYNFEEQFLTKSDFNCVMDIQAVSVMFHSDVEMHIIPTNVASKMTFEFDDVVNKIEHKHHVCDYLIRRWDQHLDGGRSQRVIWDLAIVQAIIHPSKVEEVQVKTSKENGDRMVYYYKDFDADYFRSEFYKTLLNWTKK